MAYFENVAKIMSKAEERVNHMENYEVIGTKRDSSIFNIILAKSIIATLVMTPVLCIITIIVSIYLTSVIMSIRSDIKDVSSSKTVVDMSDEETDMNVAVSFPNTQKIETKEVIAESKSDVSKSIKKSKSLSNMKIVAAKNIDKVDHIENTIGEEFINAVAGSGYQDVYATYYLGNEYKTLSFDVSCPEKNYIENSQYDFRVYADNDRDNLLYCSELSRSSARNHVDIDVTGVEFITIETKAKDSITGMGYIISDSNLE